MTPSKEDQDFLFHSIHTRCQLEPEKILCEALILREGWEMDNKGWVVQMKDGSVYGFTTSHGGLYAWTNEKMDEQIALTQESLASLTEARRLSVDANNWGQA